MAFVNLPPNLQDIFGNITDRIAKLETGPSSAQTDADTAQATATQALADSAQGIAQAQAANALGVQAMTQATTALTQANAAYALGTQSLIKDSNTITNSNNNMTAINTGGITVYSGASASTGARVIMNSAGIAGYNSGGTATFSLLSSTGAFSTTGAIFTTSTISGGTLNINGNAVIDASGFLTATGATITGTITSSNATITGGSLTVGSSFQVTSTGILTASGANITGAITATSGSFTGAVYASSGTFTGTITSASGTIGGFTLSSDSIYSGSSLTINSNGTITGGSANTIYYGYANIGGGTAGSEHLTVAGNSVLNGTLSTSGNIYDLGGATTTSTANVFMNSISGLIARVTSSERYKVVIEPQSISNDLIMALVPKSYVDKAESIEKGTTDGLPRLLGLIAEDLAQIPVLKDLLVVYNTKGQPDAVNYDRIAIALIPAIQDLLNRVNQLEGK